MPSCTQALRHSKATVKKTEQRRKLRRFLQVGVAFFDWLRNHEVLPWMSSGWVYCPVSHLCIISTA